MRWRRGLRAKLARLRFKVPLSAEGRKAIARRRWQALNPGALHYALVFAATHVRDEAFRETRAFIRAETE